jgi:hypothetical protein
MEGAACPVTFTIMVMSQALPCVQLPKRPVVAFQDRDPDEQTPPMGSIGFHALAGRTLAQSVDREIFKLASFNPEHWLLVFGMGGLMLVAVEIWKAARTGGIALEPHQGIKG